MLNTKTLVELELAQNTVLTQFSVTGACITKNHIKLEDGLPWMEASVPFKREKAKQFAQALANEMNIRILYNRFESSEGDTNTLYLVLDIDYTKAATLTADQPVPPYSLDPEAAEFMADYGRSILPKRTKKTATKNVVST